MTRFFLACLDMILVVAKIVAMIAASIVALTLTTNAALAARLPGGFDHSGWFSLSWLYWSILARQCSTAKRGHSPPPFTTPQTGAGYKTPHSRKR